jgi:DNA-binding NtrC family response regulator
MAWNLLAPHMVHSEFKTPNTSHAAYPDKPMKVLLVDDELLVRRVLAYALSLDGWEVFAHDQYADCAALIREHSIDVLVSDYRMDQITGLDLIENLRNAGIEIPVLILSANIYAIDSKRAKRLGVCEILSKPLNVKELSRKLTQAVADSKRGA